PNRGVAPAATRGAPCAGLWSSTRGDRRETMECDDWESAMGERLIGTVTHYFGKPGVAIVDITEGELHLGDTVHVVGHTSDFTQTVSSMEIEHAAVETATVGASVGVEVSQRAHEHDRVYVVTPG